MPVTEKPFPIGTLVCWCSDPSDEGYIIEMEQTSNVDEDDLRRRISSDDLSRTELFTGISDYCYKVDWIKDPDSDMWFCGETLGTSNPCNCSSKLCNICKMVLLQGKVTL